LLERWERSVDDAFAIVNESDWQVERKDAGAVIQRAYLPAYKRSVFMGEVRSILKL
jgi:hypothetical protein